MTASRDRIVAIARSQAGVTENPPGSNRVLYSTWYGLRGPWCAMFCAWVYVQAGVGDLRTILTPQAAWVPGLLAAARQRGWVAPPDRALPGDLAVFDFPGRAGRPDGVMDHVGIVAAAPTGDGRLVCVEGNTSDGGSQSNGGAVLVKRRQTAHVPAVIQLPPHLLARPEPAPPVDIGSADFRRFAAAMLIPHVGALPELRPGARGEHVQTLQHALNVTVEARLTPDGWFGPATLAAVRRFQERAGLAQDGVVGRQTRWWLGMSVRRAAGQ
jgi:hypothetical protein